jgi:hypothetical protein
MKLNTKIPPASPAADSQLAAALTVAGFLTCAILSFTQPEGFLQADDITHYLYAKWAWLWPTYLLDDWGRPGFTALYFLPAKLGLPACRITSAALMASAVWAAYRIAVLMNMKHAWAVTLFAYAQPMLLKLSQTTLTETPATAYLTWAIYLAMQNRWALSCLVLSPIFVTRHESVIFIPIWIIAAWHPQKDRRFLPLLLWAPVAVHIGAFITEMPLPILRLLAPTASSEYGSGGWLTFFCRSMEAWGPAISALAIAGVIHLARSLRGGLPLICVVSYFATQTILRALGLYATGGYARFLVPIGPMVAICALAGWQWLRSNKIGACFAVTCSLLILWLSMERQLILYSERSDIAAEIPQLHIAVKLIRLAIAGYVLITTLLLGALAQQVRDRSSDNISLKNPLALFARRFFAFYFLSFILLAIYGLEVRLHRPKELHAIAAMHHWRQSAGLADREVISASVMIDYATNVALPPNRKSVRERWTSASPGSLFAWEAQFAPSPSHAIALDQLRADPIYREIYSSPPLQGRSEPYLRLFEKTLPDIANNPPQPRASTRAPSS